MFFLYSENNKQKQLLQIYQVTLHQIRSKDVTDFRFKLFIHIFKVLAMFIIPLNQQMDEPKNALGNN